MEDYEKKLLEETKGEIEEIKNNRLSQKQYSTGVKEWLQMKKQSSKLLEVASSLSESWRKPYKDFVETIKTIETIETTKSIPSQHLPKYLEIVSEFKASINELTSKTLVNATTEDSVKNFEDCKKDIDDFIKGGKDGVKENKEILNDLQSPEDEDEIFLKMVRESLKENIEDTSLYIKLESLNNCNVECVEETKENISLSINPDEEKLEMGSIDSSSTKFGNEWDDERFLRSVEKNLKNSQFLFTLNSSNYHPSTHLSVKEFNKSTHKKPDFQINTSTKQNFERTYQTPMTDLANKPSTDKSTKGILKSANRNPLSSSTNNCSIPHQRPPLDYSLNHSISHSSFSHSIYHPSLNYQSFNGTPINPSSTPYYIPKSLLFDPLPNHPLSYLDAGKTADKVTFKLTPDYKVISDDSGSVTASCGYKTKHGFNLSSDEKVLSYPGNGVISFLDNTAKSNESICKVNTPMFKISECHSKDSNDEDDDNDSDIRKIAPKKNNAAVKLRSHFGFTQYNEKSSKK